MKTASLLVDFIEGLGYDIDLVEIPISTPLRQVNGDVLDMIVFNAGRDGRDAGLGGGVCSASGRLGWCNLRTFHHNGRPACTITIDILGFVTDSYSSQTMYLDDPTMFSNLTAFLDHWYFRIFQAD